ncbi:MAG: DEAD/DEAH box helicase, partial [Geminicoccaceae bacterium]
MADEMGLGKTIQAIGALRVLLQEGAPGSALVVVPAGLVLQWRRQLREWAPELVLSTCIGSPEERRQRWRAAAQVYLTSFDALRGDMALPAPYGPRRRLWQVVVADEAQRIKNAHTAIAATVKALPRRRAWALTGTPLENRADDAVSILDFVAPGLYEPAGMIPALRRALSVVQLRRRRAEVMRDLPPKTVFQLAPELLPVQRAAHDTALREGLVWLRSLGAALQVTHILELILRLKQICNACPRTGASAKLEDLRRRLDDVAGEGEKALVFTQFVAAPFGAEAIGQAVRPLNPVLLTGQMSAAAR